MHGRRTEVRCALWRPAYVILQTLELSTSHVGEVLAIGTRRGALVEEDGNLQLAADALAELACEGDAVLHRRPLEGNERDDVGGAHPWMLTGVRGEVYPVYGLSDAGKSRFGDDLHRRDEGDDAAVVARVGAGVEQVGAGHGGDRVANRGNDLWSAPLGEVRDALDELHAVRSVSRSQACMVGLPQTSEVSATGQGAPSIVVTIPPASRTRSEPAAMSHGL